MPCVTLGGIVVFTRAEMEMRAPLGENVHVEMAAIICRDAPWHVSTCELGGMPPSPRPGCRCALPRATQPMPRWGVHGMLCALNPSAKLPRPEGATDG